MLLNIGCDNKIRVISHLTIMRGCQVLCLYLCFVWVRFKSVLSIKKHILFFYDFDMLILKKNLKKYYFDIFLNEKYL